MGGTVFPAFACRLLSYSRHSLEGSLMIRGVFESIRRFSKNDDGPTAIEYSVMLGVGVIFCLAVLINFGQVQNEIWQDSSQALSGLGDDR